MNICITGGAGYIGSVLTERLLNLNHNVTVVDTFLHGYHGIMRLAGHPMLTVVERDIRHQNRDYLDKQDVVFHLAAISNIKTCEWERDLAWEVNRNATAEIAKKLHRDTLLIFASSTSIYGNRKGATVAEGVIIYSTHGVYSRTKLDAERVLKNDDNTIILRLATVYGVSPLMRPNSIVNDFVRTAAQDKVLVLYNNLTTRPYIHIDDCVDGLIGAMENYQGVEGKSNNLWALNYRKCDIADIIRNQIEFEIFLSSASMQFIQDFQLGSLNIKDFGIEVTRSLASGVVDLIKLYSFYKP